MSSNIYWKACKHYSFTYSPESPTTWETVVVKNMIKDHLYGFILSKISTNFTFPDSQSKAKHIDAHYSFHFPSQTETFRPKDSNKNCAKPETAGFADTAASPSSKLTVSRNEIFACVTFKGKAPSDLPKVEDKDPPPRFYLFRSLVAVNRPFSNSHGWTGSSMKWRLMRANLLKCKLICPH